MFIYNKLFPGSETVCESWYARSEWITVRKEPPQGSILGPCIFNLFQNNLIVQLERTNGIYNYADDNTIGAAAKDLDGLQHCVEKRM